MPGTLHHTGAAFFIRVYQRDLYQSINLSCSQTEKMTFEKRAQKFHTTRICDVLLIAYVVREILLNQLEALLNKPRQRRMDRHQYGIFELVYQTSRSGKPVLAGATKFRLFSLANIKLISFQIVSGFAFLFHQGHCFVAVNPQMFADGFEDRMQCLMDQYRNMEPVCSPAICNKDSKYI